MLREPMDSSSTSIWTPRIITLGFTAPRSLSGLFHNETDHLEDRGTKEIVRNAKSFTLETCLKVKANTKWITYRAMAAVLACAANVTLAQTPPTTVTNTFNINQPIPQGSANGLSDTQSFDFQSEPFSSITDLQVTLNISGGFTGDYYAYLVHDGGFAVLLNRAGRTSVNSVGYTDSGLNVTLSDSSPNDIHNYQSVLNPGGAVLTGTWAPDGRDMDPATVVETDNRTALLGSFIGADPSGQWTLYVTSLDFGEQGKLASWGLEVKGVPEPS